MNDIFRVKASSGKLPMDHRRTRIEIEFMGGQRLSIDLIHSQEKDGLHPYILAGAFRNLALKLEEQDIK